MSAARKTQVGAPAYTDYTEVPVDIRVEAEDLEAAGWVYVGKGGDLGSMPSNEVVFWQVRRWHDDSHEGPWQWCQHALCDEVRGR